MSKLITDLDPKVFPLAREFLASLERKGFRFAVLETRRSKAVQQAYFAQGREPYARVQALRQLAGLPPIGVQEAERIITRTLKSKHIDGLALDVAPLLPNGSIPWVMRDASTAAMWMDLGATGEEIGFAWGGRWDPLDKWGLGWDLPHFEVTG